MSAVPRSAGGPEAFDTAASLDRVKLRLVEAVRELSTPLPTSSDLVERVQAVALELEQIHADLLLVYHIARSEQDGLSEKMNEIDERLAAGWVPDAEPVDEVIERLRPFVEGERTAAG